MSEQIRVGSTSFLKLEWQDEFHIILEANSIIFTNEGFPKRIPRAVRYILGIRGFLYAWWGAHT